MPFQWKISWKMYFKEIIFSPFWTYIYPTGAFNGFHASKRMLMNFPCRIVGACSTLHIWYLQLDICQMKGSASGGGGGRGGKVRCH